jgi:hypothetical protein
LVAIWRVYWVCVGDMRNRGMIELSVGIDNYSNSVTFYFSILEVMKKSLVQWNVSLS